MQLIGGGGAFGSDYLSSDDAVTAHHPCPVYMDFACRHTRLKASRLSNLEKCNLHIVQKSTCRRISDVLSMQNPHAKAGTPSAFRSFAARKIPVTNVRIRL